MVVLYKYRYCTVTMHGSANMVVLYYGYDIVKVILPRT